MNSEDSSVPAGPRYETGRPLNMCPPRNLDRFIMMETSYREQIDACLTKKEEYQDDFLTTVLYSSKPSGKSTLAIHYALGRSLRGLTNVILWVDCSDKISLKRSFTRIAKELELPGYDVRDPDTNRDQVLVWLEETSVSWLIIYDNVKSFEHISHYWPDETSPGLAIVTTRNDEFMPDQSDSDPDDEVPYYMGGKVFNARGRESFIRVNEPDFDTTDADSMAKDFLMIPGYEGIESICSASDKQKILHLGNKLGGSLQELQILGSLIGLQDYTLDEISTNFNEYSTIESQMSLLDESGSTRRRELPSVPPIWCLAFDCLSPRCHDLLSVLAFIDGEVGIDREIFKMGQLCEGLEWCTDEREVQMKIHQLTALCLILTTEANRQSIGVPKATQLYYRKWMGAKNMAIGLDRTAKLLHGIHHEHIHGSIEQLHSEDYDKFLTWLPHTRALKNRFRAARRASPELNSSIEFCHLLVGCARILLDDGDLSEVLDMMVAERMALRTVGARDSQTHDLFTSTYYLQWRVFAHRGEGEQALECAIQYRDDSAWIPPASFRAYQRPDYVLALTYLMRGNYHDALEWFRKFETAWRENVPVPPGTDRHAIPLPPVMKAQEGWFQLFLEDVDAAKQIIESAFEDIRNLPQSDPEAIGTIETVNFYVAKLRIKEKNFLDAKEKLLVAQECLSRNPLQRLSQMHATYRYYLALCYMELGELENARTYIENAASITRLYQDEMPIEHARCLLLVAEVSNRFPRHEDNPAREARLAANERIMQRAFADGHGDISRNVLEFRFSEEDFPKVLEEKIFCLWR